MPPLDMPCELDSAVEHQSRSALPASVCHLVTPEYPPQVGGVGDYTQNLFDALTRLGVTAHVWTFGAPDVSGERLPSERIHRLGSPARQSTLKELSTELDRFEGPRWLLIQWVPHGYGWRSLNLAFCFWVLSRSRRSGDRVELMVHEPSLGFSKFAGSSFWKLLRHNAVAVAHRAMTAILLQGTRRVYMAIPAWLPRLQPFRLRRDIEFSWLPVPSNIPVVSDPSATRKLSGSLRGSARFLVGHFSTFSSPVTTLLEPALADLLIRNEDLVCVLIGHGSELCRDRLLRLVPGAARRVVATGSLGAAEVSLHIQACDLMLQPFPDGISTRRTGAMAALANAVPLLTTTGELSEDFWATNRYAWTVSACSGAALADAAQQLLADAAPRATLAEAGATLYRSRFTVETIAQRIAFAAPLSR